MKFSILVFPGSNCDSDSFHVAKNILHQKAEYVWHKDGSLPKDTDCVFVPGGFAYGDYLRCGAIARFSNIMNDVVNFANKGGLVIGICNGFQILTESGLLPGALRKNASQKYICKNINIRVETKDSPFTNSISEKHITIPISHGEGNYFADSETIGLLEEEQRIAFRYCDNSGNITDESNPNGSLDNIAGILNDKKNVLGMMPHPERYSEKILGSNQGISVFKSILNFVN